MNEIMVFLLNVMCIVYRVEILWEVSEMIGVMVLDGEGMISGLIMVFVVKLKLGKVLLFIVLGEIFLVLFDFFGKLYRIVLLIVIFFLFLLFLKFFKNIIK